MRHALLGHVICLLGQFNRLVQGREGFVVVLVLKRNLSLQVLQVGQPSLVANFLYDGPLILDRLQRLLWGFALEESVGEDLGCDGLRSLSTVLLVLRQSVLSTLEHVLHLISLHQRFADNKKADGGPILGALRLLQESKALLRDRQSLLRLLRVVEVVGHHDQLAGLPELRARSLETSHSLLRLVDRLCVLPGDHQGGGVRMQSLPLAQLVPELLADLRRRLGMLDRLLGCVQHKGR
mmetsp:Transcript_74838/g.165567  ORF Transcript_74838/g.165567 Transcript_74838/m.165567 type:complete len:237 (-) Transcript_74838:633-1343(-)